MGKGRLNQFDDWDATDDPRCPYDHPLSEGNPKNVCWPHKWVYIHWRDQWKKGMGKVL